MRVTVMLDSLREIVANPTSNLTVAVLLLAGVALFLLVVVMGALLLAVPRPARQARREAGSATRDVDEGDADDDLEPTPPPEATPKAPRVPSVALKRASGVFVAALVLAAVAVTYGITSQDWYCLSCHSGSLRAGGAAAPADTAHRGVTCVQCHEDGSSVLANSAARMADVGARFKLGPSGYGEPVSSQRCLGCHGPRIARTTVAATSGVAMSHAEPLAAGWACLDCHKGRPGHQPLDVVDAMSLCLRCHDSKRASAACPTCHRKDSALAAADSAGRVFGKVELITRDCEGCHSSASCDACHKTRMPHRQAFLERHAKYAAFEKKAMCFEKCHAKTDCGKCHSVFDKGHGPDWKRQHQKLPKNSVCGTCHRRHTGSMCALCHDF